MAIKIRRVVDSFDKRCAIGAQKTYGYANENHVVQNCHRKEVRVRKAVIADAEIDVLVRVASIE